MTYALPMLCLLAEASLVAVDPLIHKLRFKIRRVDAEILAAVRQQVGCLQASPQIGFCFFVSGTSSLRPSLSDTLLAVKVSALGPHVYSSQLSKRSVCGEVASHKFHSPLQSSSGSKAKEDLANAMTAIQVSASLPKQFLLS